jgi:hypothetical protein
LESIFETSDLCFSIRRKRWILWQSQGVECFDFDFDFDFVIENEMNWVTMQLIIEQVNRWTGEHVWFWSLWRNFWNWSCWLRVFCIARLLYSMPLDL